MKDHSRYCSVCSIARAACICRHVTQQNNRYPVLILQHNDEKKKPLGTAKLVSLGLEKAAVISGSVFSKEQVSMVLDKYECEYPILLYPQKFRSSPFHLSIDANINSTEKLNLTNASLFERFDCVILLDGTWRNTRELLLLNSWLTVLPTISLENTGESLYRIRKTQSAGTLSTIESVGSLLQILESSFERDLLLRPFDEMIRFQISKMGKETYLKNYSK